MFVSGMLKAARENLVTASEDAKLIEIAVLLTSKGDIVIVTDGDGVLKGVVTKTDVVRQSVSAKAQLACAPLPWR